ncbi:MAG: ROK family protein, partial [Bacilli bacterium]
WSVEQYSVIGVGASLPGYIDSANKSVSIAGAVDCLYHTDLKAWFHTFTSLPCAFINDANAAVLAEKAFGNGVDTKSLVVMTIGTGIGGGIIVNDQLVEGSSFKAGEFGYMVNNGLEDKDGVTQSLAGSSYALRGKIAAHREVSRDEVDLRTFMDTLENQSAEEIAIVDRWYDRLALGLFNIACVLNPDKILLGGGISVRSEFMPKLHDHLQQLKWVESGEVDVPVGQCMFGNDAGMVGAVAHWIRSERYDG